jgi:hypothetical protein
MNFASFFKITERRERSLWCWHISLALSFFGVAERVMMRGRSTGPAPTREPIGPSGPESVTDAAKGTKEGALSC